MDVWACPKDTGKYGNAIVRAKKWLPLWTIVYTILGSHTTPLCCIHLATSLFLNTVLFLRKCNFLWNGADCINVFWWFFGNEGLHLHTRREKVFQQFLCQLLWHILCIMFHYSLSFYLTVIRYDAMFLTGFTLVFNIYFGNMKCKYVGMYAFILYVG